MILKESLLYHHMKDRLLTFCDDYLQAPEMYTIEDEDRFSERYAHLQLRDTSDLRLDHLCVAEPEYSVSEVAGRSN